MRPRPIVIDFIIVFYHEMMSKNLYKLLLIVILYYTKIHSGLDGGIRTEERRKTFDKIV